MKRILARVLIPLALVAGTLGIATGAQASTYGPCSLTAEYLPGDVSNGLTFAQIDGQGSWFTPRRRAGSCGRIYVMYTGTYQGPTCAHIKARTYREDGSILVNGPWITYFDIGEVHRLMYIDRNRFYRVLIRNCALEYRTDEPTGRFKPGMRIWAQ